MDNKEYLDEFEQFLQDEVKQHRMYPSDHIWKNIRVQLHGYKAWPALTFISLFIISALTVSTLVNNHPVHQINLYNAAISRNKAKQVKSNLLVLPSELVASNYLQNIIPSQIAPAHVEEFIQELMVVRNHQNDPSTVAVKSYIPNQQLYSAVNREVLKEPMASPLSTLEMSTSLIAGSISGENIQHIAIATGLVIAPISTLEQHLPEKQSTADDFLKDFGFNATPKKNRNSKYGYQFYITPSNSYRTLSDDKVKEVIQPAAAAALNTMAISSQNVPLSTNFTSDVNDVVRHRPAIGIELGFAFLYNLSSRIKFKTGIQLNVRQYYIETFQSRTNDLTSLSLINSRGIETVSFYSPYNNNTGYKKAELDNKVYQLSIPLGIQWDMIQGKHFGISAEASVQPTLTLTNNTYLLSTDYKHYTGGDEFFRKWNINTSMGINITYHSGASSWQLGPQMRYQHLPTYSNLYPIKEFLTDYGIRLGYTHLLK